MQCRYCLGEDNPESMLAPCRCRGTAQFTHEVCLQQYLAYNPDRMCRICNTRMEYASTLERVLPCVFVPLLVSFTMLSTTTPTAKMFLVLGLLGLATFFAMHPVFKKETALKSIALGCLFLCIRHDARLTFWVIGFLGVLTLLRTLVHYIETHVLLFILIWCIAILYGTLLLMAALSTFDSIATCILMVQAFLVWNAFLELRPALRPNRIHNE